MKALASIGKFLFRGALLNSPPAVDQWQQIYNGDCFLICFEQFPSYVLHDVTRDLFNQVLVVVLSIHDMNHSCSCSSSSMKVLTHVVASLYGLSEFVFNLIQFCPMICVAIQCTIDCTSQPQSQTCPNLFIILH